MNNKNLRRLVLAALFLAIGYILPFFTAHLQSLGQSLLPMHIPVLICGFVCGPLYGLVVGLILPVTNSLFFTMPPMPIALAMSFELAAYGLFTGLLYKAFPKKPVYIYLSLSISMLLGRVVWGIASFFIFMANNNQFLFNMFITGAFASAIPGIIIQLAFIPPIIITLEKLILNKWE